MSRDVVTTYASAIARAEELERELCRAVDRAIRAEQANHLPDAGNMVAEPPQWLPPSMFGAWDRMQGQTVQPQPVPDGYALVPVEPTDEMMDAAFAFESQGSGIQGGDLEDVYRAMLAAAPAAPKREPLTVAIPVDVVEQAVDALGRFCSDEGWGSDDMQAMDNLDACLAQHKARITKEPQ